MPEPPCSSGSRSCPSGQSKRSFCSDSGQLCRASDRLAGSDMDAFSEILSGVKLHGALFFSAEFSSPWGFTAPASSTMVNLLAPAATHLVLYHYVIEGG